MQPVSVLLCLLGYPPFLLTLGRWTDIVRTRARMAALGHLVAGFVVTLGWFVAGRVTIALIHAAWLVVARLWFGFADRGSTRGRASTG